MSKEKVWRLITIVTIINALLTPTLFLLEAHVRSDGNIRLFMKNYGAQYPGVISTLSKGETFIDVCLVTPVKEELEARGLLWGLIVIPPILYRRQMKIKPIVALLALLIPTFFWAKAHPVVLPVFSAGILWGFLVYKTERLWPAIFCHGAANTVLYAAALIAMRTIR